MPERLDLYESPLPPARRPVPKGTGQGTGLPKLDGFAYRLFLWSLTASVLLTLYLLWGLWGGAWSHEAMAQLKPANRQLQLANIAYLFRLLQFAGAVTTLTLLLFAARAEGLGYWLLGATAFFRVGVPYLTAQVEWLRHQTRSQAGTVVLDDFQSLAWLFAVPGCLWTMADLGRRFFVAAETAAAQRATAKYGVGVQKKAAAQSPQRQVFLGRCWEGPFCRDNIRVKCPIYLKRRGPCWRYKEGCMCEERIVLQALINSEWKTQSAQAVKSLESGTRRYLSPAAKRERCRNCVIYNEHQRQKHQALSTLTVILVPLILVWQFVWLRSVVNHLLLGLDAAAKRFSFGNNPAGLAVLHNSDYGLVVWVFVLMLGVVLLAQALRLIEYCCFKLKI